MTRSGRSSCWERRRKRSYQTHGACLVGWLNVFSPLPICPPRLSLYVSALGPFLAPGMASPLSGPAPFRVRRLANQSTLVYSVSMGYTRNKTRPQGHGEWLVRKMAAEALVSIGTQRAEGLLRGRLDARQGPSAHSAIQVAKHCGEMRSLTSKVCAGVDGQVFTYRGGSAWITR